MRKNKAFHIGDGITPPCEKSTSLSVRYIGWWYLPGHRQNTDIIELYEADNGSDEGTTE